MPLVCITMDDFIDEFIDLRCHFLVSHIEGYNNGQVLVCEGFVKLWEASEAADFEGRMDNDQNCRHTSKFVRGSHVGEALDVSLCFCEVV
jgi:hypothetical protein